MAKKGSVDKLKDVVSKNNELSEQEKKKNLLFKFLVITLTLLIFSAWVLTLKNSWQLKKNNQSVSPIVTEIKQDVDETIEEISERVKKLEEEQLLEQGVQDLIDNLEEEVNKDLINPNPEQPSDNFVIPEPLPIDPMRNGCPAWINCMPTIDGPVRSCVIPPGCEGYTQLVY